MPQRNPLCSLLSCSNRDAEQVHAAVCRQCLPEWLDPGDARLVKLQGPSLQQQHSLFRRPDNGISGHLTCVYGEDCSSQFC